MIFAALALLAVEPHAYLSLSTTTGAMIADECEKSSGTLLDPCNSYILGVADTLQIDRKSCRPQSEAATLQTLTITRRYIHDHPELWGRHPSYLVRDALIGAFPCR